MNELIADAHSTPDTPAYNLHFLSIPVDPIYQRTQEQRYGIAPSSAIEIDYSKKSNFF